MEIKTDGSDPMKETALDVLMYLFEHYQAGEFADAGNQDTLHEELVAAGFPDDAVRQAFVWLDGLAAQRQLPIVFGPSGATRLYTREEMAKLSAECRGFLLYLEQLGILDAALRELVIDRLMALKEEIDLERVKWVCLLVLMNQPDAEEAFGHLEEMVYYEGEFKH
ncbi:Smg protein [Fontimonas thermophila]|uniref:Protein Smg homolog n=2 Tax=Fontimonas thermophila TaxID=1076937 RepID=A0A1I2GXW0_9GAMM|nr:Smg protein [Fontimonas thermophila]